MKLQFKSRLWDLALVVCIAIAIGGYPGSVSHVFVWIAGPLSATMLGFRWFYESKVKKS